MTSIRQCLFKENDQKLILIVTNQTELSSEVAIKIK